MEIYKRYIPIFKGIDLTTRKLPYLEADSQKAGPTVVLTAAIHGDEVTGTAVIQTIFSWLKKSPLSRGKIIALPILNPTGFEAISRSEMYAESDLNRSFGGDLNGATAERHAALILSLIKENRPDFVIDLHTDSMNSIAYTIVDHPKGVTKQSALTKAVALAKKLGFEWAVETDDTATYPLEKSLTGQLMKQGIPAVTIELGGPMVVMEEFREQGAAAIWSLLEILGIIVGKKQPLNYNIPEKMYIFHERIRTQSTGIIQYRVKPGKMVKKGQTIGKIRNVFGESIEIIKSPLNGMLFSHEDQSVTFPGQELFTLVEKVTTESLKNR